MGWRRSIVAGSLAVLLSSYSVSAQNLQPNTTKSEKAIAQIKEGDLAYSSRCGWIDWGHANGEGPKDLVRRVMNESPSNLSAEDYQLIADYAARNRLSLRQYTPIEYNQFMKKGAYGVGVEAGTKNLYLVKRGLSRKMREGVAWRIFREVSAQFERMQGRGIYALIPSTAASSFGIGDLTGNKISFYSALRGYSAEQMKKQCGTYSIPASLREFERQKHDPRHQARWRKIPFLESVPRIPRGIVKTVVKDNKYMQYDSQF